jgi:hypothetical protein
VTPKPATTAPAELTGLTESLADIVCWIAFYLERCSADEINLQVADELHHVIAGALRRLSVSDRLAFLQHATSRGEASEVMEYQAFLLELAETMGLE